MFVAILGRQPELGIAELERSFPHTEWFSPTSATIDTTDISIEKFGGTLKFGRVVAELPRGDWHQASIKIVQAYSRAWLGVEGKLTLGISAYGFTTDARTVQKTGIILKKKLREHGVSMRLIPNQDVALNTATSHHNKLGLTSNKVELLVIRGQSGRIIIAESIGAQNITALARRDQERPKRDAFVGMLPPKLAQMMVNLALPQQTYSEPPTVLDPFCGTGVLLQEALLLGYNAFGTDLADKMIDYSQANLDWLKTISHAPGSIRLTQGDAMTAHWHAPISAIATETYLGQPFSAPPSPSKLAEVRGNCNHIISQFLTNLSPQLTPHTPLCVAIPAWKAHDGSITHLPLINKLAQFGFARVEFKNVHTHELLYHRDDQVVARELLVMTKTA